MPITYHEKEQLFHLQTKNTSYIFGLFNNRHPVHYYYGKRMENITNVGFFLSQENSRCGVYGIHPTEFENNLLMSGDLIPAEYPFYGNPDLKSTAFSAEYKDGSRITEAVYKSHIIYDGKPKLSGLPATYVEDDSEAQTLELTLHDDVTGLDIILCYTAYAEIDAICRSVRVENNGADKVKLTSVLSASVDFLDKDFDFISLGGTWARENQISRQPLFFGTQSTESRRGSSGHIHSPFFALARPDATERHGEVYGFSLVYSGNFICGTEVTEFDHSRAYIGINPFDFAWQLQPGETFTAPEAVLVYSDTGIGGMSRTYHKLYRTRLARGNFRDKNRPPLANNWEGTTFHFDEEKILAIAKKAKEAHAELMVLDDGWFGERNSDTTSLGDWYPNLKKLPNGIGGLAKKINDMGLLFGLWFEPEMISPVSELYKKHPDWCIHVPSRPKSLGRNQLILDLSRDEICEFVIDFLSDFLENNPISYIKWDYNRYFSEIGSVALPAEQQSEVAHRYILGLYRILETIKTRFPHVLLEGCASGGGRFDPGQMHYFDQYWNSDNSDAIDRLKIQYGTSLVMPPIMQGAHVSEAPQYPILRHTPHMTRGHVAMTGQFGFEADLSAVSDETMQEMREQVALRKKIEDVVNFGDMYRLDSPFEKDYSSIEFLSEDKSRVVLFHCCVLGHRNGPHYFVKLQDLEPDATYVCEETGVEYSGSVLCNHGVMFMHRQDFESHLYNFRKK